MTAVEVIHVTIVVLVLSWVWSVVVLLVLAGVHVTRWARRRHRRTTGRGAHHARP